MMKLTAQQKKNQPAIRLLKKWMADKSRHDEETWPILKADLERERERLGMRKLFED